MSALKRPKDIYAGIVFFAIGATAFLSAQAYDVGAANRMGPGYLPASLGLVLIAIGVASFTNGLRAQRPDPIESHALEPFILIVASVIAFAVLIDRAGLVPALFALVLISCARRAITNPLEVLAIFVTLAAFCVFLFVYMLGMAIPLFW